MIDTTGFKPPTKEAGDYSLAITDALERVSKQHAAEGKRNQFADAMAALIGVLGSFLAGMPQPFRDKAYADTGLLLKVAIEQSLELGVEQRVVTIEVGETIQ